MTLRTIMSASGRLRRAEQQPAGGYNAQEVVPAVHDVEVDDPLPWRVLPLPLQGLAHLQPGGEASEVPVEVLGHRVVQFCLRQRSPP